MILKKTTSKWSFNAEFACFWAAWCDNERGWAFQEDKYIHYIYVGEYSAIQEKGYLTTLTSRYLVCQTWTMRNCVCICIEYNLVFCWGFGGVKIHHRLVPAHPEVGSWNMIILYLIDNVTNKDQFWHICLRVYAYFHCWVTISTRAAWQEEEKAHFGWKLPMSFCLFPLNGGVNIMYPFFYQGICLLESSWKMAPGVYGWKYTSVLIQHPLNIALAILVRPDGSKIFLCPWPAVKLEKSKTVDLRNICV